MSVERNIGSSRDAVLRALGVDPVLFDAFVQQDSQGISVVDPPTQLLLRDAIAQYLRCYLPSPGTDEASETTRKTYEGVLKSFQGFLERRWSGLPPEVQTVSRVTVADVEDFTRRPQLNGRVRSAFSVNRDRAIVSSLMRWLKRHGRIAHNPVELVDRAKEPKLLPVALSETEQQKLLDLSRQTACGLRNHTIIHLVLNTGLRLDEVSELKLSNFDLQNGWLHVTGKGNKARSIPLRPTVIESIQYYLTACRNKQMAAPGFADAVFVSERGPSWGRSLSRDALEGMLKPLLIKLGKLEGNMHVLRHSFAVNLLRRGVHIVVISTLLGHESFETTRKYLRVGDPELAREVAEYFPEGVLVPGTMRNLSNKELEAEILSVF
jgi:site-specific recombinase XerD